MRSHFLRASASPIGYIGNTTATATSTTISISPPSGVQQNDLLVVLLNPDGNPRTWTGPAGWTERLDSGNRAIYTKSADASEGSSTFTISSLSTMRAFMLCFRSAAFDLVGSINSGGGTNTITMPSISLSARGGAVIAWCTTAQVSATFTTPTNYTLGQSDSDATAPSATFFYRLNMSSGASGNVSSTSSVTAFTGYLIGVKPA